MRLEYWILYCIDYIVLVTVIDTTVWVWVRCTVLYNPHGPKVRRANYQSDSLCGCDSLGLSFDNDFWWQTVKKGGNEWKEHRPWNVWMTSLIYLSISYLLLPSGKTYQKTIDQQCCVKTTENYNYESNSLCSLWSIFC